MHLLQFDGGANPNPGPCAGAFVLFDNEHTEIASGGGFLPQGTNNIGEYTGLILGLRKCRELGVRKVLVQGDSNLVIQQVTGKWQVKQPHLRVLCIQTQEIVAHFEEIHFEHIRRELNGHADRLSDFTLDVKHAWES
jgi:ribonuclease HI